VKYGLGVLSTSLRFFLQKRGWLSSPIFDPRGRRLEIAPAAEVAAARG
jgi:hypothetical protein